MNKPILFRLRLLQAVRLGDRVHLAGAELDLPAEAAHQLLHRRRAVLVDVADLGLLLDAVQINGRPWAAPTARP
jgi:hypothetical protein